MTVFWVVAVCLTLAALLFVLPPLLRREVSVTESPGHDELTVSVYKNQLAELDRDLANNVVSRDQYDASRMEIERRLLQDVHGSEPTNAPPEAASRVLAGVLGVCIPVAALGLYFLSGTPEAIEGRMPVVAQADDAQGTPADHPDTGKQVEAMIAQLAARLQAEPDNLEGWLMMARSLRFMRRHAEAADAFERAFPMMENNAELLADYADTLAMASGGNLNGKPIDLINRALQLDPRNIQALWLKGTHDLETENYDGALESWRRIQQLVPPGSEDAQAMANNVAEVESRMRASGLAIPAVQALPAAAVAAANVSGRVKLDPALAAQVSPGDTLFIYARAATGPKMPLAILRKTAGDLPLEFRLDETMAMMPAMSLANYQDVVIGARISKDGKATAQSGDLQGQTEAIRVGSSDVDITINSVIP